MFKNLQKVVRWVLTLIIINAFDLGLGIGVQQSLVKKEPETNGRLRTLLIDNAEARHDVHRRSNTKGTKLQYKITAIFLKLSNIDMTPIYVLLQYVIKN